MTEVNHVLDKRRLNSQKKNHVTMHKLYNLKLQMEFLHNSLQVPSFLELLKGDLEKT